MSFALLTVSYERLSLIVDFRGPGSSLE
jgi:hypothetical protein